MDIYILDKYNNYATEPLTQWDANQKLNIYGLSVSTTPTILFSNRKSITAEPVVGSLNADNISCDIPNGFLTEPYPIFVFVRVKNNATYTTIAKIRIPVIPCCKPDDYEFIENVALISFEEIISMISDKSDINYVNGMKYDIDHEMDLINERLDTIISTGTEDTQNNAELLDIRVGFDGTKYSTAGEAVRSQFKNVKNLVIEGMTTAQYKALKTLLNGLIYDSDVISGDEIKNNINSLIGDRDLGKIVEIPGLKYGSYKIYSDHGESLLESGTSFSYFLFDTVSKDTTYTFSVKITDNTSLIGYIGFIGESGNEVYNAIRIGNVNSMEKNKEYTESYRVPKSNRLIIVFNKTTGKISLNNTYEEVE